MKGSKKLLLAFALVTLTQFTTARVASSTNEDSDSDSVSDNNNAEARPVSTNGTSDPILDMLDRERAEADARTEAINDNIRTMTDVDMDRDVLAPREDVEELGEETDKKKKKKKKRKGKGKKKSKKNKGKKRRKNKKSKAMSPLPLLDGADDDKITLDKMASLLANELPDESELFANDLDTNVIPMDPSAEMPLADHHTGNRYRGRYNMAAPNMAAMNKYFEVRDLETFLEKCTDCYEKIDSDQNLCPMHSPAMELKKWANELEDVLSHGCAKPENCDHPGACCLARMAPFEPLIVRMTQMLKDVFHMVQRNCKNCGKTGDPISVGTPEGVSIIKEDCTWSSWSPCSRTCGQGTQYRRQVCPIGQPDRGIEEKKECNLGPCSVCEQRTWTSWQSWSGCSKTCGKGIRERRRSCQLIRSGDKCSPNCADYPESEQDTDQDTCETPCEVCRRKEWTSWQSWSGCSVSCGQGLQERRRSCRVVMPGKNCGDRSGCEQSGGQDMESKICHEDMCQCERAAWASWTLWSSCSETCDRGVQTRERTCVRHSLGRDCGDNTCGVVGRRDAESQRCMEQACLPCAERQWSEWSDTGSCSVTCGPGVKSIRRTCMVVTDGQECRHNPPECDASDIEYDTADCHGAPCGVCGWTSWNSWSQCSVTCGQGVKNRYRECEGRRNCVGMCLGVPRQQETCQIRPESDQRCRCEEREWSRWNDFGPCSVTCGQGIQERRRVCEDVSDGMICSHNPPSCQRFDMQSVREECHTAVCEVCEEAEWGQWSVWSHCSQTCGYGSETRYRTCELRVAGRDCGLNSCGQIGSDESASQECQNEPCRCQLRSWTEWVESGCSVTCGTGQVVRSRVCRVLQLGNHCPELNQCTELDEEKVKGACQKDECCVEPEWSEWGSWSNCPVTCGEGTVRRTRSCGRARNSCRQQCRDGYRSERKSIRCGPPTDVGRWSSWSSWTTCSRSCGGGQRERRRRCSNPFPSACSVGCTGEDIQTDDCNTDSCCGERKWSDWSDLGSCSVTCGQGMQRRHRSCEVISHGPDCGQAMCVERDVDYDDKICYRSPCQVCEWSTWNQWSSCSETCGAGVKNRRRDCLGGRNCAGRCLGESIDRDKCETLPSSDIRCRCEEREWSRWTDFGHCSVTCGKGMQERRRVCEDISGGMICPHNPPSCQRFDKQSVREECDTAPCEVCEWSTWNLWSSCSETCGAGVKNRRRECLGGRNCAGRCLGESIDRDKCDGLPLSHERCRCEKKEWTAWEQWSQCTTSCNTGVRERFRRCIATVIGQPCPGMAISTCQGSDSAVEECKERDCNNFEYGEWKAWCPCDCTSGERSRRRECHSFDSMTGASVDINNCIKFGEARETEKCDVFKVCPGCIVNCEGMVDGDYQACSSCRQYITCKDGTPKLSDCAHSNTEFDSFIKKCVPAPSPSCSLKPAYSDCTNLPDGRYPSTEGCGKYLVCKSGNARPRSCNRSSSRRAGYTQEFNHHTQNCVDVRLPSNWVSGKVFGSPPGSPTCTRQLITSNHATLNSTILIRNTVLLKPLGMSSDAPADMYYDEKNGLSPEQRREQYEREVVEKAQRAAKDAKRAKMLAVTADQNESLENADCLNDCDGSAAGLYASCRGCRYYVICTKHGQFRERKCSKGKQFDTAVGKCVEDSSSCKMRRR